MFGVTAKTDQFFVVFEGAKRQIIETTASQTVFTNAPFGL
jgi:hypothetical protein